MENVMASKTLPPEQGAQKAANTNLFMRAIGLDIDVSPFRCVCIHNSLPYFGESLFTLPLSYPRPSGKISWRAYFTY